MSMGINRTRGPATQGTANKKPKGAKGAKVSGGASRAGANPGSSGSDAAGATDATVSLTGQAARLQELEGQIANLPIVDSARVAAVQNELNNGTHKIDAPKVAEKIIRTEIEFARRKS